MVQVRVACKGALDQVWDSVEALEANCKIAASQVNNVETDLQHMQQHTKKLDTYINDMLKEMLGTLNQGKPSPSLPCPPSPPPFSRSLSSSLSILLCNPYSSPSYLLQFLASTHVT